MPRLLSKLGSTCCLLRFELLLLTRQRAETLLLFERVLPPGLEGGAESCKPRYRH
jgi:hypothetical protein